MASSSSASSSDLLHQARRYDVFLSFRGEDTRNGFTSHLHEALSRSQIYTFFDNNLNRGDNISPSLLTAIKESMISVIIFSEAYANSRWCLKELTEIMQCKRLNGQIVIPVFYGVDPSHIRNQTGNFGVAFDELEERLQEGEMNLTEVRSDLKEAANISGWNSQIISPESKLIKSIVGDILNKFNRMTLNLPSNLVGIGSHIEQVETLLCSESPQFQIVGLWGMGGIGKTTIARAVFKRIHSGFEGFHFVENVSKEDGFWEKTVSKLLEEESLIMGNRTLRHDFTMKQLNRKKVLLVLDDVDDILKAKNLVESLSFSGDSRILVMSRDKQLLKNIGAEIYELVEGLNEEDSLQLFSLHAFKQNHPTIDRLELSKKMSNYAKGNPLALVVSGCALFDKSEEVWVSALDGLKDHEPFPQVQDVLKISYNALSKEEKKIFLDIACFLHGRKEEFVVAHYRGFVNKIHFWISNLIDKSLITISEDDKLLKMHDLLKKMGRCIDREESSDKPKKRTRIWESKDIIHVLKKKKGTSLIEAISVDLAQVEGTLDCGVFARLVGLRFLQFHLGANRKSKVRFLGEHIDRLSKELRYFRWDAFPLTYLPSSFCAENLVEFHMRDSKVKKLWTGKQNIVNLKVIHLHHSMELVELPDLSEGRNIQKITLLWCDSLVKFPSSSIQCLPKLEYLVISCCKGCDSAPTNFDSKVLSFLQLNGCGGVTMFPQLTSGNIITELILIGTDIREVPSSIESLQALVKLDMSSCHKLSTISTNICKLKSLERLYFTDCSNLESFPEIMEPMESLRRLNLDGCTRLKRYPDSFHNLKSLIELRLGGTPITELLSSIQHLIQLKSLYICGCQNLTSLSSIQHLIRLTSFHIRGCQNLTSLPSVISNMKNLQKIDATGCSNLYSLPELPSSLVTLHVNGCVSLKHISSCCFSSESRIRSLGLADCFILDEEERRRVLDIALSNSHSELGVKGIGFLIMPGSEIPQWFCSSQSVGSSLTLKLPRSLKFYDFVFCLVIKPNYANSSNSVYFNWMECYVDNEEYPISSYFLVDHIDINTEHLLIWSERFVLRYFGKEVSFQSWDKKGEVSFQFRDGGEKYEVTRCGVLPILRVLDMKYCSYSMRPLPLL